MKKTFTLIAGAMALCITAKAQLPNAGFETWQNYNVSSVAMEGPTGWSASDSVVGAYGAVVGGAKKQVFKSGDMHGGSFAAALISKPYGGLLNRVAPAALTNTGIAVDIATQTYQLSGGTPISQRVTSATAWLKYVPKGSDTATFLVNATIAGAGAGGADSVIGSGVVRLSAASGYTQVTVPVTYANSTSMPNRVQIAFISSGFAGAVDSSMLIVDDPSILLASGVSQSLFKANVVNIFPNPAAHTLFINTKSEEVLLFDVIAPNGQLVSTKSFTKEISIGLNEMAAGMYFFRVSNKSNEVVQTGKFMVK